MNTVTRATQLTEDERRFMRVPPYIVSGTCGTCKARRVTIRSYGMKAELQTASMICTECMKAIR